MPELQPIPTTPEEAQAQCGRTCGPCQVCCAALPVMSTKPPMNKPEWDPCEFQCKAGCRIYDERPQPCRDYFCAWVTGWGHDDWRPDKIHIMVEANGRTGCIHVKGVREGLMSNPRIVAIIDSLSEQAPVTLDFPELEVAGFIGTQEQLDKFLSIVREMLGERDKLLEDVQAELDK